MGIYIKGMEMPTGNDELRLIIRSNGQVIISHETYYEEAEAVPVPPHHGRLIDADALMQIIREHDYPLKAHFNSTDNGMFTIGIQQAVDEAPTIIPASEEGEA